MAAPAAPASSGLVKSDMQHRRALMARLQVAHDRPVAWNKVAAKRNMERVESERAAAAAAAKEAAEAMTAARPPIVHVDPARIAAEAAAHATKTEEPAVTSDSLVEDALRRSQSTEHARPLPLFADSVLNTAMPARHLVKSDKDLRKALIDRLQGHGPPQPPPGLPRTSSSSSIGSRVSTRSAPARTSATGESPATATVTAAVAAGAPSVPHVVGAESTKTPMLNGSTYHNGQNGPKPSSEDSPDMTAATAEDKDSDDEAPPGSLMSGSQSTGEMQWVDDKLVSACMQCDTPFTMLERKHHCRVCGQVVCQACSPYQQRVNGHKNLVRVCRKCAATRAGTVWDSKCDTLAFIDAAYRGDILEVKERIRLGQNVCAVERIEGMTALHAAAAGNQAEVVRLLLKAGAPVNGTTFNLRTPLHIAALSDAGEVALPLIRGGADDEARDVNNHTARTLASIFKCRTFLKRLQSAKETNQAMGSRAPSGRRPASLESPEVPRPATVEQYGPHVEILEPAAQTLQLNLLSVRNEEFLWVDQRNWRWETQGMSLRGKYEDLGLLEPCERAMVADAEFAVTGKAWSLGHLYGADVDLGEAVDEIVPSITASVGSISGGEESDESSSDDDDDA